MKKSTQLLKGLRENIRGISVALIIYIIGFSTIPLSGYYLENADIYFVKPHDLILDNIDQIDEFVIIGEITSLATVFLLWYTVLKYNFKPLTEYLLRASLMISLRSLCISLTPLAQIQDASTNGSLPLISTQYHGMFYSGHTAGAFLIYFLDNTNDKRIKLAKLFLASLTAISLLISHSHYSIDIVGGILAAYVFSKIEPNDRVRKMLRNVILGKS